MLISLARARRWVLALLLLVVCAACQGDERPLVETDRIGPGEVVQTVSAPGRVDAVARQDVAASISGVIIGLNASDGGRVRSGQTIVQLESTQVELAREQADAAERAASSVQSVAIDGSGEETLDAVTQAVADLDRDTKPRLRSARTEANRLVDATERQTALAAIEAVETAYSDTREALLASGEVIADQQEVTAAALNDALSTALSQATAGQRAQAAAAAAAADRQEEELRVNAPFAGTVQFGQAAASDGSGALAGLAGAAGAAGAAGGGTDPLAGAAGQLQGLAGASGGGTLRVGAPVVAGQTLFTVFDLSEKYVNADVDEVDAPQVVAGQRAQVLVDAAPEVRFDGVVEGVRVEAGTTEGGGVGYQSRIRILGAAPVVDSEPPPDGRAVRSLRVGMTASAEITTRTVASEAVVPSRALLRREEGSLVYILRDGRARPVEVAVLALGEDEAAVRGALAPGESIITTGYEDLRDGDEVRTE